MFVYDFQGKDILNILNILVFCGKAIKKEQLRLSVIISHTIQNPTESLI